MQGEIIFDDTGIIFYANTTFARMVNHSHQELFGFSIESFISEADQAFLLLWLLPIHGYPGEQARFI